MKEINFLRSFFFISLFIVQITVSTSGNVKKSIDDRDDNGDTSDESKDESLDIPVEIEPENLTCTRRVNSQMHEIRDVEDTKQFPFVGAVMSHQNEYLCAASVVANGLFVTTAKCILQTISYVLVNTTKDKKDEGSVMLRVTKTEMFPSYSGSESLKDVGLIYTPKHNNSIASKIKMSSYTSAANLVDVEGIGFGLNTDVGQIKPMQYIGMELRSIFETGGILMGYFDCVETKINTCFKDTGGPVIFDNELVGIVVKGQPDCTKEMSGTYAINKKIADILPTFTFKSWLEEKIRNNENAHEADHFKLQVYPMQPSRRRAMPEETTYVDMVIIKPPKKKKKPAPLAKTSSMTIPCHLFTILVCFTVLAF